MTDPGQMRISHTDRERVAEILRSAAGEGRLDLDELEERLEATFAARTYADLVPITVDLPGTTPVRRDPAPAPARRPGGVPPAFLPPPPPSGDRLLAVMSRVERRGEWVVPSDLTLTCVMGGAHLDLRRATLTAAETVVTVNAVMGGAEIVVGPGIEVVVEGTGVMGAFAGPSGRVPAQLHESSPVLRVRGFALMGGVEVERRNPPGEIRRRLTER